VKMPNDTRRIAKNLAGIPREYHRFIHTRHLPETQSVRALDTGGRATYSGLASDMARLRFDIAKAK
jgi:hypothetical protein